MEYIVNNFDEILSVVTTAIAFCAALAAVTPTDKDDKFVQAAMKVINLVGLNVGNAKNKE